MAGVKKENDLLLTNGGRVLGLTCLGRERNIARKKVYECIQHINFSGAQMRTDIGEDTHGK